MRLSEGVEWGAHCAALLAIMPPEATLSTGRLAEFHGVPVAYLAKHLQAMARAGILDAGPGRSGGYRLARPAAEITLLDVVEAIDGADPPFVCHEIRRRGPTAVPAREYRALCGIHVAMLEADEAWRASLRATSIADLADAAKRHASPKAIPKFVAWFQEVSA